MAFLPGIGTALGTALKAAYSVSKAKDKQKSSSSSPGSTNYASQLNEAYTNQGKGSESSYSYDTTVTLPGGKKVSAIIKDGYTYIPSSDGYIRPPADSIVETRGGTFVMGKDGKGTPYSGATSAVRAQAEQAKSYSPQEVISGLSGMLGPSMIGATPWSIVGPTMTVVDTAAKLAGDLGKGYTDYLPNEGQQQQIQSQQMQQYLYQLQQQYNDLFNSLNDTRRDFGYDIETSPMYKKYLDEALETITAYENQLMEMLKQQMGGVDPATQAALANLREGIQRQRDELMEEMSRRGLLQSGMWLEMEDRLGKGELTAQQQLLAGRLSDLQSQMNQALQNFAGMRLGVAQTYGIEGARAAEREALARRESMERQLQMELDEAYRKQQLGLSQFQTYAPYMYLTEAQRQSLPLDWAQVMGQVPQGPGYEPIPARNYVGDSNIDYDSKTGDVIIAGQRVNPSAVGGYINSGTAYIPKNIIDSIMRRFGGM
jgi:hypothetical protein